MWLQPERVKPNGSIERAVYCIRDTGGTKIRTGFGVNDLAQAEARLAEYIAEKNGLNRERHRSSDQVIIANVLAIYASDVAPRHARPKETLSRIERLNAWWGDKRLSEVTARTCRGYVEHRKSPAAARRELEDFRAAIRYQREEGLCREVVDVVLPERPESRTRWMTRDEAAKLLWTAWKRQEYQKGKPTTKRPWRHVARYILLGIYTGTRASTICAASFDAEEGFGWVDLNQGVWYRKPDGLVDTKKRRPPIPLPARLIAHMRRWQAKGQSHPVEFRGQPVLDVDKAFRLVAATAGLPDVTPHVMRHTAATWLMQASVDKWEAAGYVGMTMETLERVYSHHHPDYMAGAVNAMNRSGGQVADKNMRKDAESFENFLVDLSRKAKKINSKK